MKPNLKFKTSASIFAILGCLAGVAHVHGMDEPNLDQSSIENNPSLSIETFSRNGLSLDNTPFSYLEQHDLQSLLCISKTMYGVINNYFDNYLNSMRNNFVKAHKNDENQPYRLLSLDGGGQRAEIFLPTLIALQMLTGMHPFQIYDGIGGTSTGGITAIGLSYKNPMNGMPMSPMDILKMYHHCSREIFRETAAQGVVKIITRDYATSGAKKAAQLSGVKHDHSGLEKLAYMLVGKDKFQADKFLTDLFVTTVNESKGSFLEIFSTLDPDVRNAAIWQVIRCTSAAKTFFQAIQLEDGSVFVDGGHMSNHPAADIFNNIKDLRDIEKIKGNRNVSICSLGTGDTTTQKSWDDITSEWVLGKTLGTVQDAFTSQERSANKQIAAKISEYENAKIMGADFSKSKLPYIESYLRSQTAPLEPALHEMDMPQNTQALLKKGLQQLYFPETLNIFKSLFAVEIPDGTLISILKRIEALIISELHQINMSDIRDVTLLGNVCSFINAKESKSITDQTSADLFFNNALNINVDTMKSEELSMLLLWTSKMLEMNESHRVDTTTLQKVYSGTKGLIAANTSHGMIDLCIKNLCMKVSNRTTQIMRNECQIFNETLFIGGSLKDVCTQFYTYAKPAFFQNNQEEVANKAFLELFSSKLLPEEMKTNTQYKDSLLVLLNSIIHEVGVHFDESYGVTTWTRNSLRSLLSLPGVQSSHQILIQKLIDFREEIKHSLENS